MAQEAAAEEVDEEQFARASAAVSRLTEVFSPAARALQPSLAGQVGSALPSCLSGVAFQAQGCVSARRVWFFYNIG